MTVPVLIGVSAYQFNMFFNNTMMSAVEPESVTLFNFVQTLILSSVMTLVLAITSVKYPALTVCAAKEDMMGFRKELSGTMGGMIYLLTPIAFGLVIFILIWVVRTFRKKIYANHFSKEYLELELQKKDLETRIERCLEAGDCVEAQRLCDKLALTVEQMQHA